MSGSEDSGGPANEGGYDGGALDAATEAGDAPDVFVSAPHPAWPQVPGNAMVILHPMKLVTVVASGDPEASDLFAFGDALVASQWWQTIGADYGLGTPTASVHATGAAMTANPSSSDLEPYIASAIAGVPETENRNRVTSLLCNASRRLVPERSSIEVSLPKDLQELRKSLAQAIALVEDHGQTLGARIEAFHQLGRLQLSFLGATLA